jgi:hypothetical protein
MSSMFRHKYLSYLFIHPNAGILAEQRHPLVLHLGVTVIVIPFGMSVVIFVTKLKCGIDNIKTLFCFSIIIAELERSCDYQLLELEVSNYSFFSF